MGILTVRKLYATTENGNSKNNLLDFTFKGPTGITLERINAVGTYLAEICMFPLWKTGKQREKSYPDMLSEYRYMP